MSTAFLKFSIPRSERRGLLLRLAIVCSVSALTTLGSVLLTGGTARPGVAAAYSFGIGVSIWLMVDVGRFVLRRPLGADGPAYWPRTTRAAAGLLIGGNLLGYLAGTRLGDWVGGRSTLDLLEQYPARFAGALVPTVLLSIGFAAYFYQRERAEWLARHAREAELRALQSQLEPHMLFNTLANLRVLIAHDPPKAQDMVDHLVAFLRATLQGTREPAHPLAAEFARIGDYLALMAVRMGPRLRYTLDLPEPLRDVPVAPLLLQPLVENAIRHGLEPQPQGGMIEVSARADGARLLLAVADTGAGPRSDASRARGGGAGVAPAPPGTGSGTGFGLEQVRSRLTALYGARASLELAPHPEGGATAWVELPLASPGERAR